MPALLTTTSMRPKAPLVASNSLSMSSALATSPCTAMAAPPAATISATTSSAMAWLLA